jgi:hypothetical protein
MTRKRHSGLRGDCGKAGNAAVIHDWVYWNHSLSGKEADDIFFERMELLEGPSWKRKTIYYAVR